MKTDFFNKLKTGALLVIAKPDRLHVMKLLEDYEENSFSTSVFLKCKYSTLCACKDRLRNSELTNKTNSAYIVMEEF